MSKETSVPTFMKDTPCGDKSHFWHFYQQKHLQKMLYRSIQQARNNPDYAIKHPNEIRDNPTHKLLREPNNEANIRIHKEHIVLLKNQLTPKWETPKRLNRIG